jgi:hypothetical protein
LGLGKSAAALRASPCPLCQLFGAVARPYNDWPQFGFYYELRAISQDLAFTRLTLAESLFDTNVLSIETGEVQTQRRHRLGLVDLEKPSHGTTGSNLRAPPLDAESCDFTIAKDWIRYCQSDHITACRPSDLLGLPSFPVIDLNKTRQ